MPVSQQEYDSWPGCLKCKHVRYDKQQRSKGYFCAAFPDGIPGHHITGTVPHLTKSKLQTGDTVFEPIDD